MGKSPIYIIMNNYSMGFCIAMFGYPNVKADVPLIGSNQEFLQNECGGSKDMQQKFQRIFIEYHSYYRTSDWAVHFLSDRVSLTLCSIITMTLHPLSVNPTNPSSYLVWIHAASLAQLALFNCMDDDMIVVSGRGVLMVLPVFFSICWFWLLSSGSLW